MREETIHSSSTLVSRERIVNPIQFRAIGVSRRDAWCRKVGTQLCHLVLDLLDVLVVAPS